MSHDVSTGEVYRDREPRSWRVLYDLLDNFGPVTGLRERRDRRDRVLGCSEVFTVKLWVFFLAYYVHLGRLEDPAPKWAHPSGRTQVGTQVVPEVLQI